MNVKYVTLLSLSLFGVDSILAKHSPNIVYILADDLGYGDIQSYNPEGKFATPHTNAMAENGVSFTDAHTSASVSSPTRYGVLTGRYSWRSRLKGHALSGYSPALIDDDRTTVADILKSKGYSTAMIGKWHLGWGWDIVKPDPKGRSLDSYGTLPKVNFDSEVSDDPNDLGFDYYYGFCGSLDMSPYVWVENGVVVEKPTRITFNRGAKFWRKGPTAENFHHENTLQEVADRGVKYIREHSTVDKPFFLYLPLPSPHTPILPSEEFLGKSGVNVYGDYVMQTDDVVGQIRNTLKDLGIAENTILIFTSDNGCSSSADIPELNRHGHYPCGELRGVKGDLYEGGHRVPYIVEWAKGADCGVTSDATICSTDLFATIAELTHYNMSDNEGEDSYTFMPYLKDKKNKSPRDLTVHHSGNGQFAIRKGDWKLIFTPQNSCNIYPEEGQIIKRSSLQLYNIKSDISEQNNLISKYPEIVDDLVEQMQIIIKNGRSTLGEIQQNDAVDGWHQADLIFSL